MRIATVMVVSLVIAPGVAVADELAVAQKTIVENFRKLKSIRCKTTSMTEMSAEGFKMKSAGEGLMEMVRRDGKMFLRQETKEKGETEIAGQSQKTEGVNLMVSDGELIWTLSEANGQKNAAKMKASGDWDADPFEQNKDQFEFKLLPDEKLDGSDVYVIEMKPKASDASQMGRMMQYIRKDHGFTIKQITYDLANKPISTVTYTDVEFNADIPAERFKFTPPAGVEVMDMTATPTPETP